MNRTLITRMLRVCAIAAMVSVCSDGPSGPVAGPLKITMTTGASGRAVLLRITSTAPYSDVTAARPDLTVFSNTVGAVTNVAIFGPIAGGPLVTINVPDVSKTSSYIVSVIDMADGSNAILPTAGSSVRVER
jgi:hypothetical protein